MLVAWGASCFLLPAHKVRRSDGTRAGPLPDTIKAGYWYDNFSTAAIKEVKHIIQLKDEWRIWVSPKNKTPMLSVAKSWSSTCVMVVDQVGWLNF